MRILKKHILFIVWNDYDPYEYHNYLEVTITPTPNSVTTSDEVVTPGDEVVKPVDEVVTTDDKVLTTGDKVITAGVEVMTAGNEVVKPVDKVMTAGDEVVAPVEEMMAAGDEFVPPIEEIATDGNATQINAESGEAILERTTQIYESETLEIGYYTSVVNGSSVTDDINGVTVASEEILENFSIAGDGSERVTDDPTEASNQATTALFG